MRNNNSLLSVYGMMGIIARKLFVFICLGIGIAGIYVLPVKAMINPTFRSYKGIVTDGYVDYIISDNKAYAGRNLNYNTKDITGELNIRSEVTYDGVSCPVIYVGECTKSTTYNDGRSYRLEDFTGDFYRCSGLTKVVLPAGITVGNLHRKDRSSFTTRGAFRECTGLREIKLNEGVVIDQYAFRECTGIEEVSIPENSRISEKAFYKCTGIKKVNTKWMRKPRGSNAFNDIFEGCNNIKTVNILSGIDKIPASEFSGMNSITTINIPDSVKSIESFAFTGTGITGIDVPDGVTELKEGTFKECSNLKRITIPGIRKIGAYAFEDCSSLEDIDLSKIEEIVQYAFHGCTSLKSVDLSNIRGTYQLFYDAFSGCTSLIKVILPDQITKIESEVFSGCESLSDINLEHITVYGNESFTGCKSLKKIDTEIECVGTDCFSGCTGLESVRFASDAKIARRAFWGCTALKVLDLRMVSEIDNEAFRSCTGLKKVLIADVLEKDDKDNGRIFYEAGDEAELIISDGVTKINDSFFGFFSGLKKVTFPDSLASIGKFAFSFCIGLENVSIPDNVSSIGEGAFSDSGLTSITIPAKVSEVSENTFSLCNSLKTVQFKTVTDFDTGKLRGTEVINYMAFKRCVSLTDIVLPGTLTEIGTCSFFQCCNLPQINIPESVKKIGDDAFAYNNKIEEITIPETVEVIEGCPFRFDYSLAKVINKSSVPVELSSSAVNYNESGPLYDIKWANEATGEEINSISNGTAIRVSITEHIDDPDASERRALINKVPLSSSDEKYAAEEDNFAADTSSGNIKEQVLDFSGVKRSDVKPSDLEMTVISGSRFTTKAKLENEDSAKSTGGIKVKVNKKTLIPSIICKKDGTATLEMEDGVTYTITFRVQKPKAQKSAKNLSKGSGATIRTIKELFGTDIDAGKLKILKQKHSQATVSDNSLLVDPEEKDSIKAQYDYLNKKYKVTLKIK